MYLCTGFGKRLRKQVLGFFSFIGKWELVCCNKEYAAFVGVILRELFFICLF